MSFSRVLLLGFFVLTAFLPVAALAQHSPQQSTQKDWEVSLTPYLWLTNFRTDINGQVVRGNVDQLASITNSALMVIATARWRNWSVSFDGFSSNIGNSRIYGPLEVGVTMDQSILTSRIGYKFLDTRQSGTVGGTALWAYLGTRKWTITPGNDYTWDPVFGDRPPTTVGFSLTDSWWDALVGTRAHFEVTEIVHFVVRGNIGGFGIDDSSSFTWDLGAYSSFRFWDHVALHAGYQWLSYDRTAGDGLEEVTTKYNMNGLFLGMSLVY